MRRKTIFSLIILMFLSISCFAEEKLQTFVSGAYDVYLKDMGLFYTSTIRDDIFFDKDNFLIDQYGWKRIISNDLPFSNVPFSKPLFFLNIILLCFTFLDIL